MVFELCGSQYTYLLYIGMYDTRSVLFWFVLSEFSAFDQYQAAPNVCRCACNMHIWKYISSFLLICSIHGFPIKLGRQNELRTAWRWRNAGPRSCDDQTTGWEQYRIERWEYQVKYCSMAPFNLIFMTVRARFYGRITWPDRLTFSRESHIQGGSSATFVILHEPHPSSIMWVAILCWWLTRLLSLGWGEETIYIHVAMH